MKLNIATVLFASAVMLFVPRAMAQPYSIDWHTIDGGGGPSTDGAFALSSTIGQPDAGEMSGSGYTLSGGFWSIEAAVPAVATAIIFDNTLGEENGVESATATSWLANKFCVGSQPYRLDSLTLLLRSLDLTGFPPPITVRLHIYSSDPLNGKPLASTGVIMKLSGMTNPITLPSGVTFVSVMWSPATSFNLSADTCSWAVLSVESGVTYETASATLPTGPAGTFGRTFSSDAGTTWSTPDRFTNRKMLIRGTALPTPRALLITAVTISGNELRFSFPASSGQSYVIESRADLAAGEWAEVSGSTTTSSGAALQLILPIALAQPQQFFRVKQWP